MRRDHAARYRREETIADAAKRARQLGGVDEFLNFNVVDFARGLLNRMGEKSEIQFFDRSDRMTPPAHVRMRKGALNKIVEIELHVERATWSKAQIGDPEARYVIAHEIGHIVLHKDELSFFSNNSLVEIKYLPAENRAEWQAHKFARHLLLPSYIVDKMDRSLEAILHFCGVPGELAEEAVAEADDVRRRRISQLYSGDACSHCGNFTLMRNGKYVHCDTCQSQSSEFGASGGDVLHDHFGLGRSVG